MLLIHVGGRLRLLTNCYRYLVVNHEQVSAGGKVWCRPKRRLKYFKKMQHVICNARCNVFTTTTHSRSTSCTHCSQFLWQLQWHSPTHSARRSSFSIVVGVGTSSSLPLLVSISNVTWSTVFSQYSGQSTRFVHLPGHWCGSSTAVADPTRHP